MISAHKVITELSATVGALNVCDVSGEMTKEEQFQGTIIGCSTLAPVQCPGASFPFL